MKLHITNDEKNKITGIENIVVKNNSIEELQTIIDNSCTFIFLDNAMDCMDYENAVKTIFDTIRKVRLGGELVIKGICFDKISSLYVSGELDVEEVNKKLCSLKSFQNYANIVTALENSGFQIGTISHAGLFYEIKAKRIS
jgi:hypothetical protein